MNGPRYLLLCWLALTGLTLANAGLGHGDGNTNGLIAAVVALTALKGNLVINGFMGLGQAPAVLRIAVHGWLLATLAVIMALLLA
ncbi:cytochrome C oxidase subunit IV family protein [Arhodomonas sp. AD133]|uniref:cytochrome C oxidase subunit IV family protein n=1 Tax=Arhodomonas sp. AD133 TaxID=3415009 RepID=UPI003EC06E9C